MSPKTVIYVRTVPGTESTHTQHEKPLEDAAQALNVASADTLILSDSETYARPDDSSGHQRLFDLAASGDIERVIMRTPTRIARNMHDLNDRLTRLVEAEVAVHIIEPGLQIGEAGEDAGPDDRTLLRVLGIAAKLEMAVKSEQTKEGIAAARAAGKHIGRPPFGFTADGNRGLIPNEDFETALTVIEEIEAGKNKRSTARGASIAYATVENIMDQKDLYHDHAAKLVE